MNPVIPNRAEGAVRNLLPSRLTDLPSQHISFKLKVA